MSCKTEQHTDNSWSDQSMCIILVYYSGIAIVSQIHQLRNTSTYALCSQCPLDSLCHSYSLRLRLHLFNSAKMTKLVIIKRLITKMTLSHCYKMLTHQGSESDTFQWFLGKKNCTTTSQDWWLQNEDWRLRIVDWGIRNDDWWRMKDEGWRRNLVKHIFLKI